MKIDVGLRRSSDLDKAHETADVAMYLTDKFAIAKTRIGRDEDYTHVAENVPVV